MWESLRYTPTIYLPPEVISVCQGRGGRDKKAVCIFCLILGSLAAGCYANSNTKENRGSLDLYMSQKRAGLQMLVNINIYMVVSLFLGIHYRYNFCPDLV